MEKTRNFTLAFMMVFLLFASSNSYATTIWDIYADYSKDNNPNGAWSYGRKWSPESSGFDLLTVKWGTSGWYMGNVGHGAPSIHVFSCPEGDGPNLWAKNNTNGLPVIRWTSPESGLYSLNCKFAGNDTRGVDNYTYVAINNTTEFSDRVQGYLDTTEFSYNNFYLVQNDTIDFMIEWTGAIDSETCWTAVTGTITQVPEPATMTLLSLGILVFYHRRRSSRRIDK